MAKLTPTIQTVADTLETVVGSLDMVLNEQKVMRQAISELTDGQHSLMLAVGDLSARQDNLESQQRSMQSKLDIVSDDLGDLKGFTESGFDVMNDRFDRVEERFDHLEGRVERIESGLPYQH